MDVLINDGGTVVTFLLVTKAAQDWVRENLETPSWSWLGANSFTVDYRQADIIIAMMEDQEEGPGLRVR